MCQTENVQNIGHGDLVTFLYLAVLLHISVKYEYSLINHTGGIAK